MGYASVDAGVNNFAVFEDGHGRTLWRLFNNSGATVSAKTVGKLTMLQATGKNGFPAWGVLDFGTTGLRQRIIVAAEDVLDQTWGLFYIGGPNILITVTSAVYTTGDGLLVDDSSNDILDSGALAVISGTSGLPADFAAVEGVANGAARTELSVFLFDRETLVRA